MKERAKKVSESFSENEFEDEGPGPKAKSEKILTKKERIKVLKTQKVLSGRIDDIEIQGWSHLFA